MTDPSRDVLQADVVCVGAGIASLSAALRFLRRTKEKDPSANPSVWIFEKGKHVGAHVLSGAVLNTDPLRQLLTDDEFADLPLESVVRKQSFYRLTDTKAFRLPFTPPPMSAKGMPLCSLSKLARHLGALCEAEGADIYTETAVTELLNEGNRIHGVRVGDKGVDRAGRHKPNFEAGAEVHAKLVILGEGACGFLTEQLVQEQKLDEGREQQTYALGIKELIETESRPDRTGKLIHTFGYPLDSKTYGGGFVYALNDTQVAVGFVTALDYRNPALNPHDLFRAFKEHPIIRPWLDNGQVVSYGAKMLPERGFFAVPEPYSNGVLIVGDGAGLLDAVQLKGADLAIQSGLAAGDTAADAWELAAWDAEVLSRYADRLQNSKPWKPLYRHRNVRAWFQIGQIAGIVATALAYLTRGILPPGRRKMNEDHMMAEASPAHAVPPLPSATDKQLQLDVLSDLYYSGTEHEEDQPSHVDIKNPERCLEECRAAYGVPCTRFCPAQVYEFEEQDGKVNVVASNCLHCRTCQVKCPIQNVDWRLPEGGGGPRYKEM